MWPLPPSTAGSSGTRPFEHGCGRVRISPQHLGEAVGVVEADERVGDDEPTLGRGWAPRQATARSARAWPRGRTRGSRRPAPDAIPPRRTRRAPCRSRRTSGGPAAPCSTDSSRNAAWPCSRSRRYAPRGVTRSVGMTVVGFMVLKRKRPPGWKVSRAKRLWTSGQSTLPPRSQRHAHAHVEVGKVMSAG